MLVMSLTPGRLSSGRQGLQRHRIDLRVEMTRSAHADPPTFAQSTPVRVMLPLLPASSRSYSGENVIR